MGGTDKNTCLERTHKQMWDGRFEVNQPWQLSFQSLWVESARTAFSCIGGRKDESLNITQI